MSGSVLKSGSLANIQKIEDDDVPIESYFVNESDSSSEDSLGNEENTGLAAGLEASELMNKNPQELIDNSLTSTLKKMATFPPSTDELIKERGVEFGESKRHKTLIFDMDETLIHAEIQPKSAKPIEDTDFTIVLKNQNDKGEEEEFNVFVKMRPYYDECIENLSKYYEIAVFTAGEQEYADAILDVLDPDGFITHRLYRQHCICVQDRYYVKDLRIIQDRELENIVLVDNSVISFAYNLDNGVPCAEFYRWTKDDEELLYLHSYLDDLFHKESIPLYNKEKFKLRAI